MSVSVENKSNTRSKVPQPPSPFSRVLVGVDGSDEAIEAARQAALLAEGSVTLLAVYEVDSWTLSEDLRRASAADGLDRTLRALGERSEVAGKVVQGCPWNELIHQIERSRDTVVVVGSHGIGRASGILVESTTTELVHKAPCSVLVTRGKARIPRRIVVGVDGSPESARAFAVARDLAGRFGAHLRTIVDHDSKPVDMDLVRVIAGDGVKETFQYEPVRALVGASGIADLVVVGSRGLHGLNALRSVSERVAHQAACSVLVVREAPWQRAAEPEISGA
jgi:nucleotide-binding universal stress UspA family protein